LTVTPQVKKLPELPGFESSSPCLRQAFGLSPEIFNDVLYIPLDDLGLIPGKGKGFFRLAYSD
jgi:hypothetical protein